MTHELGPLPEPDSYEYLHAADTYIKSFRPETVRAYAAAEVARAVEAERERCARICDGVAFGHPNMAMLGPEQNALKCAAAIRAQAHGRTPGSAPHTDPGT